jgi:dipeptide transport system permease protein
MADRAGSIRGLRRLLGRSVGAAAALVVVSTLALVALAADALAPHDPAQQFREALLMPPAWAEGGSMRFVLGTDDLGRDIASRLIWGARVSLAVGLAVIALAAVAGIALGAAAAACGRLGDVAVMRLVDVMLALPSLLLALVVVAVLGPGLLHGALAVAIVQVPHFVRVSRAVILAEMPRDYVTASRVAGAGPARVLIATVLPNCAAPLIVQATLGFSAAILDLAALGFLGLGAQPPTPEWGAMLANGMQFLQGAWWVVTLPGLAILITVLAFNLLGDGLRDVLDPRLGH